MPRPRVINFGQQTFQPITEQQTPKSILAQLLLQRGSGFDPRVRGSGLRSAGELIAGALLKKSAFDEQKEQNQAKAKAQGELIKSLFKDETVETQAAIPAAPGLPDVDERINRPDIAPEIQEQIIGSGLFERSLGPQGGPQPFASGNAIVNQPSVPVPGGPSLPFSQAPDDFLQVGQQFQGQSPEAIAQATAGVPRETETRANQLGQLLSGINQAQADQGGVGFQPILNAFQQQRQAERQAAESATKFGRQVLLKQLDNETRRLISDNTIQSREKIAGLNREAKAGERVKVNVKLGNDTKSGRPISQVGFALKSDPTDIKFIGKPTTQGKGAQVNVSNLPQIPAALLTGITQSDISLRALGRVEDIMSRVDISGFVGPVDSRIGAVLEAVGAPNKDQQTIGNITKDLTDALGRMRSGGVISEQEWETFMALVPQRTDPFQTFVNKLNDFKAKMNDIRGVNLDAARTFGFNTGTADTNDVTKMTNEQLQAIIDGR